MGWICLADVAIRTTSFGACLRLMRLNSVTSLALTSERIAFGELSPFAEGARHCFLRASYALWMVCRNFPPRPEALTSAWAPLT